MLFEKEISKITLDDIKELVNQKVSESKYIEYKKQLPVFNRKEKIKILAQITSFANASGGLIIYGIDAYKGVPKEICGLNKIVPDDEILRISGLVQNCIKPRIPNLQMKALSLEDESSLILIKVPRSWIQPHVVECDGHWRFYSRNSAGKYALDVEELKQIFNFSDSINNNINEFKIDRINKILRNDLSIKLSADTIVVLHLLPIESFFPFKQIDISVFETDEFTIAPIYAFQFNCRYNFEGYVSFSSDEKGKEYTNSYSQVFRNGCIEATYTITRNQMNIFPLRKFHETINDNASRFLKLLKKLNISTPIYVSISLLGMKDYELYKSWAGDYRTYKSYKNEFVFNGIVINSYEENIKEALLPIYNSLWNAFGLPKLLDEIT